MSRKAGVETGNARPAAGSGTSTRGVPIGALRRVPVLLAALLVALLAFVGPSAAGTTGAGKDKQPAYAPGSLIAAAKANPDQTFQVIVEGKKGKKSAEVADKVRGKGKLKRTFRSIGGVAVELSGREVLKLVGDADVLAVTPDAPAFAAATTAAACADGRDNDGDRRIDYGKDPGCSSRRDTTERDPAPPPPACADGQDNDGDGAVDTNDRGCESSTDTDEYNPLAACEDGSDNDGDGLADYGTDPGCESGLDEDEYHAPLACEDGWDNDGDGLADYGSDPGCESGLDEDEYNTPLACEDGWDNDGDGSVDGDDPGCAGPGDDDEYNDPGPDPIQTLGIWPDAVGASALWGSPDPDTGRFPQTPTIAVVDSGIDADRAEEFGGRVVGTVNLSSLTPDASGDGDGHGTFVAAIAASSSESARGVAPGSDIVSIRVMNDEGVAMTSDVIAAADWILQNKDAYGIRVANFSLHSGHANSFKFDPLDHAVERLVFSGVVVVTAAGNFGSGQGDDMLYAPANDPFVITVGAADIRGTSNVGDDTVAPWSAFGYTADGFGKPELVAPGRYMVAAVPEYGRRPQQHPGNVTAPGKMRMSGTSFAAPVVAGAAAQLLAQHPEWTPGQVKGALMLTARPINVDHELADGVGEVDIQAAAAVWGPPDANAAINPYVVYDESVPGGYSFDAAAWSSAAWSDAAWSSAAWSDAAWSSAAWSSAAWSSAAWSSAAWASAAWSSASEADSALADKSQGDGSSASATWVE
jgi:serine protease AprX